MPILTIKSSDPRQDLRQSENALMIQRGVMRYFQKQNYAMISELTLDNGMRADLCGIGPKGELIIVEIKSSLEDFRSDRKWQNYRTYCDYFYFASHKGVDQAIFPPEEGFLFADHYGSEIIRESSKQNVKPHIRKQVQIRIARTGIERLNKIANLETS